MPAITIATGYPIRTNLGAETLYIVRATSVADGDTYASGLGSNVRGYWANAEADETAGDEGVNVSNSSGTFTIGSKTTGTVTLYILATT